MLLYMKQVCIYAIWSNVSADKNLIIRHRLSQTIIIH